MWKKVLTVQKLYIHSHCRMWGALLTCWHLPGNQRMHWSWAEEMPFN